jgi:hypothetical protein
LGIGLLVTGSQPTSSAIRAAHFVGAYTTALLVAGNLYMALISPSARPRAPRNDLGQKSMSAYAVRKVLDGPAARLAASHAGPRAGKGWLWHTPRWARRPAGARHRHRSVSASSSTRSSCARCSSPPGGDHVTLQLVDDREPVPAAAHRAHRPRPRTRSRDRARTARDACSPNHKRT